MKKFLTLTLSIVAFIGTVSAQVSPERIPSFAPKSYDDIVNDCHQIDAEKGKIYLPVDNEDEYGVRTVKEVYTVKQIASLMKKDVFGYFGLNQKYSTPLQKNAFTKTEEYANYMSEIDDLNSYVFDSKFYILYHLRYNQAYDLSKKAFVVRIQVPDFSKTNQPGYLGLGDNINVMFPTSRFSVKKERAYHGGLTSKQYLPIPIADENLALKIEEDMANPYCSTYLMFVVKLYKTSTEQHPDLFPFKQEHILTKTIGLYIVNTKTKEVYCDLTKLLSVNNR